MTKTTTKRKTTKGVAAARTARANSEASAESAAFKEGRAAAKAGQGVHTNPYPQHPERLDWSNGYFSQQGV